MPGLLEYGIPLGMALAAGLFSALVAGLFLSYPKLGALPFFLAVLVFVNTSYGLQDPDSSGFSVYTKGGRYLPFPIIQFYLYGLFLGVMAGNAFQRYAPLKHAGRGWMWLFTALFVGHYVVGLVEEEHWWVMLSQRGLLNIIHMMLVIYITVSVLKTSTDLNRFAKIFLAVAIYHAVFGLVRFVFLGGDPQNAYSNYGSLNIRITFWDVNQGLIASIAAFYFAWRLTRGWSQLSTAVRWMFLAALVMELLVVIFSFRRSNWFGLLGVALFFVYLQPPSRRWVYGLVGAAVVIPAVLTVSAYRAQETLGRADLTLGEILAPDTAKSSSLADRSSRFYELVVAWDTVKKSPLFGTGLAGRFDVAMSDHVALGFQRGRYDFVHSGFGHVLLKSGFTGLMVFLGLLSALWFYASRRRGLIATEHIALFDSFRAGVIFLLPNLATGTPIPEFRTMVWLGLVLAVPVAVAKIHATKEARKAATEQTRAGIRVDASYSTP